MSLCNNSVQCVPLLVVALFAAFDSIYNDLRTAAGSIGNAIAQCEFEMQSSYLHLHTLFSLISPLGEDERCVPNKWRLLN